MLLPKNKTLRYTLVTSILLNLGLWAFLYWRIVPQVDPIVLRYSVYFGINLIGEWWHIFIFPLFGSICLIINTPLSLILRKKDIFLAKLVSSTTLSLQILLTILGIFVTMLNV